MLPRKTQRGVTFLEVLISIGLIGIIAAFIMINSRDQLPLEKLIAETKLVSLRLGQASLDARASGRTAKIICSSAGIQLEWYQAKSDSFATAITATSSSPKVGATIDVEASNNDIYLSSSWTSLNCSSNRNFYITSHGTFFSGSGIGGVELEFNLPNNLFTSKLVISGENALGRIYLREKLNAYSDI